MSIYKYDFVNNSGDISSLSDLKDKVILIVNVASKCGFTSQYEGLEKLYKDYKDQGLEIIAFPCNQFGGQEPGSDEEIKEFCTNNFGVTFTIASKIDVNGDDAHPIYKYLKDNFTDGRDIRWNFGKFLIKRNEDVTFFDPQIEPKEIEDSIKDGLK
jgi:glutathione peroxidase